MGDRPRNGGDESRVNGADGVSWAVRPYQVSDLVRLHEIDQVCFPGEVAYSRAELRFYLHHPNSVSHVADSERGIAGFVVGIARRDGTGHVITLDVLPGMRRRGIGKALISALHADFLSHNIALAVLEVSADNAAARCFYERLGYQYEGLLPGYYGGKTDAFRMVRRLGSLGDLA